MAFVASASEVRYVAADVYGAADVTVRAEVYEGFYWRSCDAYRGNPLLAL